jgi:hypothetical protein
MIRWTRELSLSGTWRSRRARNTFKLTPAPYGRTGYYVSVGPPVFRPHFTEASAEAWSGTRPFQRTISSGLSGRFDEPSVTMSAGERESPRPHKGGGATRMGSKQPRTACERAYGVHSGRDGAVPLGGREARGSPTVPTRATRCPLALDSFLRYSTGGGPDESTACCVTVSTGQTTDCKPGESPSSSRESRPSAGSPHRSCDRRQSRYR